MFGGQYSWAIDNKPGWADQSPGKLKKKSNFLGPPILSELESPMVGFRNVIFNKHQNLKHCSKVWFLKTVLILTVAGKTLVPIITNRKPVVL